MDQGPTSPASPSGSRPRPRSRGISFRSDKSGGSESKRYSESPRDKARRDSIWKGTSKANPNAAVNEVQPAVANVLESTTLDNLRDYQHKDVTGNVISDPDRSNPTRPRMERPLDTIRSFERAIDDGYRRRTSYIKQDSESWDQQNQFASRRSSYFGACDNGPSPNRYSQNGGYYGNGHNGASRPGRYANNRMQSDPGMNGQKPYAHHGHHQSHDTVNTGYTNGSDSTGPWANSTDPSSENSSIDRSNAMNTPPTPSNGYSTYQNGYNGPIMEEQGPGSNQPNGYGQSNAYGQANGYGPPNSYSPPNGYGQQDGAYGSRSQYGRNGGPMPPAPTASGRRPIPLGGSGVSAEDYGMPPPAKLPSNERPKEEKKSWIKRRFSKKD